MEIGLTIIGHPEISPLGFRGVVEVNREEREDPFPGAPGVQLSARLSLPPDGEVRACALFAHCFTCSIFHSPVDATVGIENAALIYNAARHPKSFVSLDDADHLLLRERDSLYVGSVPAAWAGRCARPATRGWTGSTAS